LRWRFGFEGFRDTAPDGTVALTTIGDEGLKATWTSKAGGGRSGRSDQPKKGARRPPFARVIASALAAVAQVGFAVRRGFGGAP
jgi:hypothetical protein